MALDNVKRHYVQSLGGVASRLALTGVFVWQGPKHWAAAIFRFLGEALLSRSPGFLSEQEKPKIVSAEVSHEPIIVPVAQQDG